jgi:hypothetical protein
MKFDIGRHWLETLSLAIAHSPIVVRHIAPRLPVGFDQTDAAVLEWIAAEGRRVSRGLRLM